MPFLQTMRLALATALGLALVGSLSGAAAQTDSTLEPVACMDIDSTGIDTLYQSIKDVVLSIQVCISDEEYANAAELYFVTWPFLMFNQEATKDDYITRSYISALDATLQHYFAGMTPQQQEQLGTAFDAITQDKDYRQLMCQHLWDSRTPIVNIRQDEAVVIASEAADGEWRSMITRYGCSSP